MRTLLIILMMALAPLRVWAGEVMALGMLAQQLAATHHVADMAPVPAAESLPAAHADCMGHAPAAGVLATVADDADADAAGASADCPTCSVCQACSVPALALPSPWPSFARFTHAVPAFGGTAHASAAPAPGLKPPIS